MMFFKVITSAFKKFVTVSGFLHNEDKRSIGYDIVLLKIIIFTCDLLTKDNQIELYNR